MTPPAPPMDAERLVVVMPGTLTCGPFLKICAPLTRPKGGLRARRWEQRGASRRRSAPGFFAYGLSWRSCDRLRGVPAVPSPGGAHVGLAVSHGAGCAAVLCLP